ncbi:MAG TPA: NUDIX hydrolase [Stellaceae bacterium]|jgi:ADP-ribose pyrophosphatase YjhB (NUDIX family)
MAATEAKNMDPRWLVWAKALQAISQTGLTYGGDKFDVERYEAVRRIAAEIMAAGGGDAADTAVETILDFFRGQSGYATPKVDVRGAVFRGDRVLLVREETDGRWALPGGWADVNQSAAECVVREVAEEAGLGVTAVKLAAVYDRGRYPHVPLLPFHVYKLFFICREDEGGDRADAMPPAGAETTEARFFAEDALPDLSMGRVLDWQIHRMFLHHREPARPTDFD